MRLLFSLRAAACGAVFCAAVSSSIAARADDQTLIWTDQGPARDAAARSAFYSQDQGSRIMPLAWLSALKRRDGQLFLADGLARYDDLPNPASGDGLPVGFTSSSWQGDQSSVRAARHVTRARSPSPARITGSMAARRSSTFRASSPISMRRSQAC